MLKHLNLNCLSKSQNKVSVKPKLAKENTFHRAISFELLLAQCFGLFPLRGITNPDVNALKFTWCSVRVIFSLLRCFGISFSIIIHASYVLKNGVNMFSTNPLLFNITGLFSTILFFRLAKNWPELMKKWSKVDVMMRSYGFPTHLERRMKLMTLVVMAIALLEHCLMQASNLITAFHNENNFYDAMKHFFASITFTIIPYSFWKGCLLISFNLLITFSWSYLDLFIMIISSAIALRFKQITDRLQTIAEAKVVNEQIWRILREDYNRLCKLTRSVDEHLSYIILLSYVSNLYFVLFQLFNSLREMKNTVEKIYFFVSFGFLIMRIICVSFYGGWINEESRVPMMTLNSVPSYVYNVEIKRLIQQIDFNGVGLTGRNFFSVTRGLILSIAGAIVTYELVLIQFSDHLLKDYSKNSNATY